MPKHLYGLSTSSSHLIEFVMLLFMALFVIFMFYVIINRKAFLT